MRWRVASDGSSCAQSVQPDELSQLAVVPIPGTQRKSAANKPVQMVVFGEADAPMYLQAVLAHLAAAPRGVGLQSPGSQFKFSDRRRVGIVQRRHHQRVE